MTQSIFGSNDRLKEFLEKNPNSLAFAHLASRMVDDGEYQSAVELCEKGLSSHPNYAFGYFILGTAHYHIKNYTDAKKSLEKSLAFDPNNPRAWEILSAINEILNLTDDAHESNLQSYLVDSLREDASSQFIPDVEFSETEESNAELDESQAATSETVGPVEEKNAEETLDSIAAEGESEFDFDKALDEVFRDKENAAVGSEVPDSAVEESPEIEGIEETDPIKGPDMVSAEEFTSAIESFFDDHEDQTGDSLETGAESSSDDGTIETPGEEFIPSTGKEEEISEAPMTYPELPDEMTEETRTHLEEFEEITDELTEPSDAEIPGTAESIEEISDDISPEFTTLEEEDVLDSSSMDSTEQTSTMDDTQELLKNGLSEEFAAEELIEGDLEEIIPEDMPEDAVEPEKQVDDELLDFKSFVSDVISDSDDADQGELKSSEIPTAEQSDAKDEDMKNNVTELSEEEGSISELSDEPTSEAKLPEGDYDFPKEEDFDLPDISSEIPDISADAIQLEDTSDASVEDETHTKFSRPPILSPTLGEIYIAQGRFEEAVSVFQQLLAKDPQNSRYQRKIDDLKTIIAKKKMES